jgi:hypothetical protein
MRKAILVLVLILVMLFLSGFSDGQTIATTPAVNSTQPIIVNTTTNLGSYGDWSGYAVNQYGTGIGDIPITLHIMGNYSNQTPYEIYSVTRITNNSSPWIGYFNFNDVIIKLSGVSSHYGYLDTVAPIADNQTMYGRTDNHTLMYDSACTVGSLILTSTPGQPIHSGIPMSSPMISVSHNNVFLNQSVTVSGQNFTPNRMAVLYVVWTGYNSSQNYSARVDTNGNTSWSFNVRIGEYSIYALDGNSTSKKSNTLTISASLNGATPSPGFAADVMIIALIATAAALIIEERSKKK